MHGMILPPSLKNGDVIAITAPASMVEKQYVENSVRALNNLGYEVLTGEYIFSEFNQFAGTDEQRHHDFQKFLDDRSVKAIFCARGGYGSIRIAHSLDFSVFRKRPKWIVGFSDITVFHTILNTKLNIASIHAPMPVNFSDSFFHQNLGQLDSILRGSLPDIHLNANPLNRAGKAKGKLIGGNLSILYSLQATPFETDTAESILFIEDVGEQLYHLDRMMNNFRLSGKLKTLSGLIVGGMTAMEDKKRPFGKTAYEIICDAVKDYHFPVAFDFQAGHTDNNIPFILGSEISLRVDGNGAEIKYITDKL